MIEIYFTLNGKRIRPGDLADTFERAFLKKITDHLHANLDDIQCPEHKLPLKINISGQTIETLKISLEGCCEKMLTIAKERFNS